MVDWYREDVKITQKKNQISKYYFIHLDNIVALVLLDLSQLKAYRLLEEVFLIG